MADPIALVTGVTGQDGALLAELLLAKGYEVHGIMRRSSTISSGRLDRFYTGSHECSPRFFMHYGDLTDGTSLLRVLQKSQPSEIYNLGGQSHVKVSFETAESTADVNALGALRLLEAIRTLGMADRVRFFQAGSSEMFGSTPPPQNESTPFRPRSPYAISKLHAYWITANYREAYNLHASNGILFNHEGPTRGETFVTRKITTAVAAIDAGRQEDVSLGNLNARRDWGHARDYVEGVWRMLQQDRPDDYVLATGEAHTVREFVELAFKHVGVEIDWQGEGVDEKGLDAATGRVRVKIDPSYFRPTDVHDLRGDASKAREKLGWRPTMSFEQLVQEMVDSDRALLRRERNTEESGVR